MKLEKIVFTKKDGTEIVLSKEEANELHHELASMFGDINYHTNLNYRPWHPYWPSQTWCGTTSPLSLTGAATDGAILA